MDLSTIKNVNELKAMAYDQLVILENAQNNLKLINQRLAEVEAEKKPTDKK